MRHDPKVTEAIGKWLYTDRDKRDFAEGARLWLRISGQVYLYETMLRKGASEYGLFLEKKLKAQYELRLAKITREQVKELEVKATAAVSVSDENEQAIRSGRRDDHDSLPDEVKALYAEALDCLQKMRECNVMMRRLALSQATCPESELYPWVKEICRLDDRRLECWRLYDNYGVAGTEDAGKESGAKSKDSGMNCKASGAKSKDSGTIKNVALTIKNVASGNKIGSVSIKNVASGGNSGVNTIKNVASGRNETNIGRNSDAGRRQAAAGSQSAAGRNSDAALRSKAVKR